MGISKIIIEFKVPKEKEYCIFYFCVTNDPKRSSLKNKHLLCHIDSMNQESRPELAECLWLNIFTRLVVSMSTRALKVWLEGCGARSFSKLSHVITSRIQFLAGCWLEASLSSLHVDLSYRTAHNMEAGFLRANEQGNKSVSKMEASPFVTWSWK